MTIGACIGLLLLLLLQLKQPSIQSLALSSPSSSFSNLLYLLLL